MFFTRCHARSLLQLPTKGCFALQRRHIRGVKGELFQTPTEVAEKLHATNVWSSSVRRSKKGRPKGDWHRVNIVDEKLCDDIIDYIKPSLRRHEGCDIIDIFPGAGVWSKKLSDLLQPRSHILLEPDEVLYKPFLEPLLAKPNTILLPQSGIVWAELNEILTPAYLPHQIERSQSTKSEPPQRNDTLLVTANLSLYPKRRYHNFESVAHLVLFQFISAIRASSLFQKYGLVRVLVWIADDEKKSLLPRSVQQRRRLAVDAELSTDWVTELAGADASDTGAAAWFVRDRGIDLESTQLVLERMREQGVVTPPGRETQMLQEILIGAESGKEAVKAGQQAATFDRPFMAEYEQLKTDFAEGLFDKDSEQYQRMKTLKWKVGWTTKRSGQIQELLQERDAIADLYDAKDKDDAGNREEIAQREAAWNDKVSHLNKALRNEYLLNRDNLHIIRQDPPVLNWDRRWVEPLVVKPTEFYPNVPCCLLDIQPKAMHHLFREMGPRSSRSGDIFELVLRGLLSHSNGPVSKALEAIYPGAADGVLPYCPSIRDTKTGGVPVGGWGEISSRSLNETQLVEILAAWMKWPFAPTYPELVCRVTEEADDVGDEDGLAKHTPSESM
ncbi:rRNA adenine dimethylase-like protein [Diplogelasinospora grovesii]|uniref:rRNA adenine N(6)-methyltransferase n=1 Tax=Diplogelasinospora grovesii TaxID=303347 RepID=A0AAN6MY06_9PEZI|nr:rRNA adenine dimethylase-like protein [Diplogelasinospora grovesii]